MFVRFNNQRRSFIIACFASNLWESYSSLVIFFWYDTSQSVRMSFITKRVTDMSHKNTIHLSCPCWIIHGFLFFSLSTSKASNVWIFQGPRAYLMLVVLWIFQHNCLTFKPYHNESNAQCIYENYTIFKALSLSFFRVLM